jgi:hypothetical protein
MKVSNFTARQYVRNSLVADGKKSPTRGQRRAKILGSHRFVAANFLWRLYPAIG